MQVDVWLMYKKGEPRTYTTTLEPPDWFARKLRADGFKIYRSTICLPVEHETKVDGQLLGFAKEAHGD